MSEIITSSILRVEDRNKLHVIPKHFGLIMYAEFWSSMRMVMSTTILQNNDHDEVVYVSSPVSNYEVLQGYNNFNTLTEILEQESSSHEYKKFADYKEMGKYIDDVRSMLVKGLEEARGEVTEKPRLSEVEVMMLANPTVIFKRDCIMDGVGTYEYTSQYSTEKDDRFDYRPRKMWYIPFTTLQLYHQNHGIKKFSEIPLEEWRLL